jgi:hypothetical protein
MSVREDAKMSKVVVDAALRAKLNGLDREIEFCDEAGNVLGYFLTPKEHEQLMYAWAKSQVTDEELEAARKEQGGMTTEELLAHLEALRRGGKEPR